MPTEIHNRIQFKSIQWCKFNPQEFMVSTSVLRNESAWTLNNGAGQAGSFVQIGDRGNRGQSSTSGIDRNNVQFYTLVQQNAIGCWNLDADFQNSIDIIAQDNTTLVFPNDLKLDQEIDQVGLNIFPNFLLLYFFNAWPIIYSI